MEEKETSMEDKEISMEEKEIHVDRRIIGCLRKKRCVHCNKDIDFSKCFMTKINTSSVSKTENLLWNDLSFEILFVCLNSEKLCQGFIHASCLLEWTYSFMSIDIPCINCGGCIVEYFVMGRRYSNLSRWLRVLALFGQAFHNDFIKINTIGYTDFSRRDYVEYKDDHGNITRYEPQTFDMTDPRQASELYAIIIQESIQSLRILYNLGFISKNQGNDLIKDLLPECHFCHKTEHEYKEQNTGKLLSQSCDYFLVKCCNSPHMHSDVINITVHQDCVTKYFMTPNRVCIICGKFAKQLGRFNTNGDLNISLSNMEKYIYINCGHSHSPRPLYSISHMTDPTDEFVSIMLACAKAKYPMNIHLHDDKISEYNILSLKNRLKKAMDSYLKLQSIIKEIVCKQGFNIKIEDEKI